MNNNMITTVIMMIAPASIANATIMSTSFCLKLFHLGLRILTIN